MPNYVGAAAEKIRNADAATPAPLVDQIRMDVERAVARVSVLTDSVREITDSLIGSQPAGETDPNKRPRSAGRVFDLREAIDLLQDRLTELEGAVGRLHAL